jgi:hypothetical protein
MRHLKPLRRNWTVHDLVLFLANFSQHMPLDVQNAVKSYRLNTEYGADSDDSYDWEHNEL